jgi:small conductance mechanosensitive channel
MLPAMTQLNDAFYLLAHKLQSWLKQLVLMLPNLFIALLVLVFTFFAARLIRKAAEKLLSRISHSAALNNLITTFVYVGTLMMGIFFALGILKLDKTVTSLLAGVGIIGLALGFAFQDIAANFISGVIIAVRKPFGVGDVIETNDHFGTIERINLRTVDIRRQTGELVKVPNRKVFENALINFTHYGVRRIDLKVHVSNSEDLDKVVAVILQAIQDIKGQVETKEVEVVFDEFEENFIRLLVRFWIHYVRQTDYVYAKSEAIMKIRKAFDANNIIIPLPGRSLYLDTKHPLEQMGLAKNQMPVPPIPVVENVPKPEEGIPPKGPTFEEATDARED